VDVAVLRRWWPLAAVLGLLFLTSLAATRSAPQLDRISPDPVPARSAAAPLLPSQPLEKPVGGGGSGGDSANGIPGWLGTAAIVVLSIAGLAVVGLAVYAVLRDQSRRRKRRKRLRLPEQPETRTQEDLVAALDAGLEELSDADRDPRRAVIACWVRLEQAAAAAGTPRHPGDTPTDLVGRLLAEQQVDSQVLAALLEVYRQARYATHTVDDQMREQAREALQRLRADLGAGVSS
jgi:ABC-type transporter Mla MlaB component